MYQVVSIEDTVRVPPRRFNEELVDVITQEFEAMLVGRIDKEMGVVLSVTEVTAVGDGKIILGDGAIYYKAMVKLLVYQPQVNEVVEGVITELTEFGAFVNFGPIDGLIHVSQITEDFMSYDQKNSAFVGRETNKLLQVGDIVKARIITVSVKQRIADSKIGLTMRQPYLGKLEWIEEVQGDKSDEDDDKKSSVKDKKVAAKDKKLSAKDKKVAAKDKKEAKK